MLFTKEILAEIEKEIGHDCQVGVSADERGLQIQVKVKDPKTGEPYGAFQIFSFSYMRNDEGALPANYIIELKSRLDDFLAR